MSRAKWRMALRNLARNKRRNIATGIAVSLGFAAFLAIGAYLYRVQNYLRVYTIYATRVGHITIFKANGLNEYSVKPRDYSLDAHDQQVIQSVVSHVDNVELFGAQLQGSGLVGNGCRTFPFLATGIDPQLDRQLREHPEMKRWAPNLRDYIKGRGLWEYSVDTGAVALSEGLSRLLHKQKVHDEFGANSKGVVMVDCQAPDAKEKIAGDANVQLAAGTWTGMMSALDGEVVATFKTGVTETNNAAILTSLNHLQKLYDTPNVTFYSLWLKNPRRLGKTLAEVRSKLKDAGLHVDVYPWTDEGVAPFYTGTMQFLYTMVIFITFVLATIVIFSVFNSATMTVIERSQEIGMMRSLGYTRRHIRELFVMESILLAIISVIGGAIIGAIGIFGVNHSAIHYNPPGIAGGMILQLVINAPTVIGSSVLIFVLAVMTTLVAVRGITRRNIANLVLGTQR